MNKEVLIMQTNEVYMAKAEEIVRSHPDRLLSVSKKFDNIKDKVKAIIEEARLKNYTILPADGMDYDVDNLPQEGIVLSKEIDGVELAYNPRWKIGELGVDTKTLLGLNDHKELWMDDIGPIANDATDLIIQKLKEFNIELKDGQEDDFFVPIFDALEKYSNCNYRHEH